MFLVVTFPHTLSFTPIPKYERLYATRTCSCLVSSRRPLLPEPMVRRRFRWWWHSGLRAKPGASFARNSRDRYWLCQWNHNRVLRSTRLLRRPLVHRRRERRLHRRPPSEDQLYICSLLRQLIPEKVTYLNFTGVSRYHQHEILRRVTIGATGYARCSGPVPLWSELQVVSGFQVADSPYLCGGCLWLVRGYGISRGCGGFYTALPSEGGMCWCDDEVTPAVQLTQLQLRQAVVAVMAKEMVAYH